MRLSQLFNEKTLRFIAPGSFVVLGIFLFGGTMFFDFISLDDPTLVTRNPLVQSFSLSALWGIFTSYDPELYIPLTLLSYQLEFLIAGNDPALYHLTNVVLHICNAMLVFVFLKKIASNSVVAWVTAIFFLIHPLHSEAVAWVSSRKDLLSAFFALLCLASYVNATPRLKDRYALPFFIAGLMAKVSIAPLPVVLMMINGLRDKKTAAASLKKLLPFFLAAAVFVVIGLGGKASIATSVSPITTLLVGTKALCFYAVKLITPTDLRVLYVQESPVAFTPEFITYLIVSMIMAAGCGVLWKRGEKRLSLGLPMYMIMVLPSLMNILKNGEIYYASDRYAYLASIGFLFGCIEICRRLALWVKMPRGLIGLIIAVNVIVLMVTSVLQTGTWANSFTVFTRALKYHPDSIVALDNRGMTLVQLGMYEEALVDFKRAAKVRPDDLRRQIRLGEASIWAEDYDTAATAYTKALTIDPYRADAHFGLGLVFTEKGDEENASAAFQNAVMLDPVFVQAKLAEAENAIIDREQKAVRDRE